MSRTYSVGRPNKEGRRQVYEQLLAAGYSVNNAIAHIANIHDESAGTFNYGVQEYKPLVEGSKGGHGLYQLTGHHRRNYFKYVEAKAKGLDSTATQIAYVREQIQGPVDTKDIIGGGARGKLQKAEDQFLGNKDFLLGGTGDDTALFYLDDDDTKDLNSWQKSNIEDINAKAEYFLEYFERPLPFLDPSYRLKGETDEAYKNRIALQPEARRQEIEKRQRLALEAYKALVADPADAERKQNEKHLKALQNAENALAKFEGRKPKTILTNKDSSGNPLPSGSGENPTLHEVVSGDTLSKIGERYGVPYQEIADANNISNANNIRVGQKLKIPDTSQAPTTAPPVDNLAPVEYRVVETGATGEGELKEIPVEVIDDDTLIRDESQTASRRLSGEVIDDDTLIRDESQTLLVEENGAIKEIDPRDFDATTQRKIEINTDNDESGGVDIADDDFTFSGEDEEALAELTKKRREKEEEEKKREREDIEALDDALLNQNLDKKSKSKPATWDQPHPRGHPGKASPYPTGKYPHNHVFESESGHIIEFDDSPTGKRILTQHTDGTFEEIVTTKAGHHQKVVRVEGDDYEIVAGSKYISIGSSSSSADAVVLTVHGNMRHLVKGDYILEVEGEYTQKIHGSMHTKIGASKGGDKLEEIRGSLSQRVQGHVGMVVDTSYTLVTGDDINLVSSRNLSTSAERNNTMNAGTTAVVQSVVGLELISDDVVALRSSKGDITIGASKAIGMEAKDVLVGILGPTADGLVEFVQVGNRDSTSIYTGATTHVNGLNVVFIDGALVHLNLTATPTSLTKGGEGIFSPPAVGAI